MLTNYTKLADLYAIAKARADQAAKEAAELRDQILATGQAELIGDAYAATVSTTESERIDSGKVRNLLAPRDLRRVISRSQVTTVRIKAAIPAAA